MPTDFAAITPAQVLTELGHIVAAKGSDYVYVNPAGQTAGVRDENGAMPSCFNFALDGTPSCGVGHWYALHGLSSGPSTCIEDGIVGEASAASVLDRVASDDVIRVLATFQSAQDSGKTWGRALEEAYEMAAV